MNPLTILYIAAVIVWAVGAWKKNGNIMLVAAYVAMAISFVNWF